MIANLLISTGITAKLTMDYLHAEGINAMPWPACSHDMNAIEHLWDQLKKSVYCRVIDDFSTQHDFRRITIDM